MDTKSRLNKTQSVDGDLPVVIAGEDDRGFQELTDGAGFPITQEEFDDQQIDVRKGKIEAFALSLIGKRDEAIKARSASGVEGRWIDDSDAFHGRDGASRTDENWDILRGAEARQSSEKKPSRRSRVFVQITRQKTNAAAARLQDLLFPSDERNWQVKPTPVPMLSAILEEHGNERVKDPMPGPTQGQELPHPTKNRAVTAGDVAEEALRDARKRCGEMQKEIDDQHVECGYNDHGRKAIEDAAKLGTGILKGPIVVNRTKKAWLQGPDGWAMQIKEDLRPATTRVDPWNFFPAPGCGDDFQKGGYCWEREPVSAATLKTLLKVKSYDQEEILECLEEGPKQSIEFMERSSAYIDSGAFDKTNFDLWNFWGDVSVEDLEALGVPITDELRMQKMSAAVVMCNGRVIKAILNPLDTGDLPYDMFAWDHIDDSPWGVGIPYLMRYAQRSLNAAWRQMQDNAGVAHGPQIVVNRKLLEPANKSWQITGMKTWYTRMDAQIEDVSKAFQVFQIQSNQAQLEAIIQLCLRFIDDETAIPMLAQGEQGSAPEKVGIVSMLMNASNVILKRLARNWDGRVTNPHIRRYYDWNMQYSEREDLKGDYSVHALGSTTLVVRDQQKQDIANLMQMSMVEQYSRFVNPQKVMEYAWKMSSVPDVLYSETELKEMEAKQAEQPPQEDPKVQVAKIVAQATIDSEKVEAESEKVNQQLRMEEAKRNDEREIYKMELMRDLEVLKQANAMNLQVNEIKAQLAGRVMDVQAKIGLQANKDRAATVREGQKAIGKFQAPKPAGRPQ